MKYKKEICLLLLIIIDIVWFLSIFYDFYIGKKTSGIFDIIMTVIFIIITVAYYLKDDYFAVKRIKKDSEKNRIKK